MATNPSFVSTPRLEVVQVGTANTNRDGSGTLGTLITGAAAGTRVFEIVAQAAESTTAGMVRIFLSTDGGTTKRLIDEISIAAATASGSVKATRNSAVYQNLVLEDANCILYASTHVAEDINVCVMAADLT